MKQDRYDREMEQLYRRYRKRIAILWILLACAVILLVFIFD